MKIQLIRLNPCDILLWCFFIMVVFSILTISPHKISFIEAGKWSSLFLCYTIARKLPQKQWILWMIVFWGVTEAILGICQKLHWLESHHTFFEVTGTFGNPGPLGGLLSIAITTTFGIYKPYHTRPIIKSLQLFILLLLTSTLLLSDSRAGWLATLVGCGFVGYVNYIKNKTPLFTRITAILVASLFCFSIYYYKKDSADGRLLIWRVTADMIMDAPLEGHGIGSFQQMYMNYQAHYFKMHPSSRFKKLADNTIYPYNEFLHIAVEMGTFGILYTIIFTLVFIRQIPFQKYNITYLGTFISLLVFSMFSYPSYVFFLSLLYPLLIGGIVCSKKTFNSLIHNSFGWGIICLGLFFTIKGGYEYKGLEKNIKKLNSNSPSEINSALDYINKHQTELKSVPIFFDLYAQYSYQHLPLTSSLPILQLSNELTPTSELLCDLGELYLMNQQPDKALDCFLLSNNMTPNRILPKYKLFWLYHQKRDTTKMLNIGKLITSTKVKIENTKALRMKGEIKRMIKDSLSAIQPHCQIIH